MRPNVQQFIQLLAEAMELPGPILDIGSMRTEGQEDTADLRPYATRSAYLGFDMRAGPGVDALGSIHHLPLLAEAAGTVLVLDMLEHVLDPIASMQQVCSAVKPGGVVVMSSHMNFPIHAHPSDYWRFTPMIFDHLLHPLATRFVFMQGDAENPHNVMAVGMKASIDGRAEIGFRRAMHDVQSRWGIESYGGPLIHHLPLLLDVSQRDDEIDLPELVGGRMIEQRFVCGRAGLSRIDIKMRNPSPKNLRHVMIRVLDVEADRQIASHRVLGWHVIDDAWLAVPVPAQAESSGRLYAVSIESPDGVAANTVGVKGSAAATPGGGLRLNGELTPGSIAFQTYCEGPKVAAGDVQVGEDTLARPAVSARSLAVGYDARQAALDEQQWEQTRFATNELKAELDALREQIRENYATLLDLQQRTLEASTEKLIARTVRDNPVSRVLRRKRGAKDSQ